MVRAFGGLVIVKDDATAAKLVTQHGLACITLDGKISRPGSMQVHHLSYVLREANILRLHTECW